jgi:hypothetical protein
VKVTVTDAQIIRAHIDTTHHSLSGTMLTVPVVLDDAITIPVDTLTFSLRYHRGITRLRSIETDGLLLDGWKREVVIDTLGGMTVRFIAVGNNRLDRPGDLLTLRVQSYLGDTTASALPFELTLGDQQCLRVETQPGLLRLDSICGLSLRLIESSANKNALLQNEPNPFNPVTTISFSLAFDEHARLEVFNASGEQLVLLVSDVLSAGSYEVEWDASDVPSGVYYYRLTTGSWSSARRMVVVK